ncbi:hypothetical protein IMY05_001G0116000 [Salix suchowensis]|nr:hypothetical protein IMY05_001G0116000 [Salix suchowensis]
MGFGVLEAESSETLNPATLPPLKDTRTLKQNSLLSSHCPSPPLRSPAPPQLRLQACSLSLLLRAAVVPKPQQSR